MSATIMRHGEIAPPDGAHQIAAMSPMTMLNDAMLRGASGDQLDKLISLYERWSAMEARRSFDRAMSALRAGMPIIQKGNRVSHKGGTYSYESLADIARAIDGRLADLGLSYRYRTAVDGTRVTVTCVISHRDGHFEEVSLSGGVDVSGSKNSIQAIGSTVTYLQRYTLKAALGLSAAVDDDGRQGVDFHQSQPAQSISPDDAMALRDRMRAAHVNEEAFCRYLAVGSIDELPYRRLDDAIAAIEKKARMNAMRQGDGAQSDGAPVAGGEDQ